MSDGQQQTPPPTPETPPAPQQQDGQQQQQQQQPDPVAEALAELGIQPDEQGRIPLADHQKLVSTVKTLREQIKSHDAAQRKAQEEAEKARLESLSEQERAVEEARKAGYEAALAEQREVIVRTQVVAAATLANFADPDDALRYLDVESLTDDAAVKKAVAKLAEDKAYLLKPTLGTPPLEQGPRNTAPTGGSGDFLADAIRRRRAG